MSSARPGRFRFGPFEFDATTGELWRRGVAVPLQAQPARVLARLLRAPGQLVSREELRREVWGETTHVDFRLGLNYCIRRIRVALDDSATTPAYVETLPGRGYRFRGAVEPESERLGCFPVPAPAPVGGPPLQPEDDSVVTGARTARPGSSFAGHARTAWSDAGVWQRAKVPLAVMGGLTLGVAAWLAVVPVVCPATGAEAAAHHAAAVDAARAIARLALLRF